MSSAAIMRITLLALVPGTVVCVWWFGWGVLLNLLTATVAGLAVEALMLKLRKLPMRHLNDCTAIVTAILLGLCLPPLLPIWMVALGVAFALIFGKHVYGGMGNNLFNPSMVGFAVLIISFPLAMNEWPAAGHQASLSATVDAKLRLEQGQSAYDGITAATPLDAYKFRHGATNEEFFEGDNQQNWLAWAQVNLAFLAGGLLLLFRKIIPWQLPAAMLATLGLLSIVFYDGGSSVSLGSPVFQLFSGATMLAAFFIITDPVTAPRQRSNLLIYGAGIGLITFVIRGVGAYPEGVAFAVLLMNAGVPLLDQVAIRRQAAGE